MQKMVRMSGAAVLLIIIVPLCMYSIALFVGIELGRALERSPDSAHIVGVRGLVQYFAKELRRQGRGDGRILELEEVEFPVLEPAHPVDAEGKMAGEDIPIGIASYNNSLPKMYPQVSPESSSMIVPGKARPRSHNRKYTLPRPRGVTRVGAWGGSGGQPFSMCGQTQSPPRLHNIEVYHSSAIHALSCVYSVAEDGYVRYHEGGPWGEPDAYGKTDYGKTAVRAEINLSDDEHITAVEGTTGRFRSVPGVVITSLTFRTSAGKTYGPYGGVHGTRFSVPVPNGSCVAGFWGRSGWLLDAIGVYIRPRPAVPDDVTPE